MPFDFGELVPSKEVGDKADEPIEIVPVNVVPCALESNQRHYFGAEFPQIDLRRRGHERSPFNVGTEQQSSAFELWQALPPLVFGQVRDLEHVGAGFGLCFGPG